MREKISNKKIIVGVVIVIILLSAFCWWNNNALEITEIQYTNKDIPEEFDGYRIVHLSDLHNKEFGKDQKRLVEKIKEANGDIIIMTGDMVDNFQDDITPTIKLMEECVKIAPCYFVSGNHEVDIEHFEDFKKNIENIGVDVLDSEIAKITIGKDTIDLMGLRDANFISTDEYKYGNPIERDLNKLIKGSSDFKILLAHRPEYFDWYSKENSEIDLVFSGHAHGGQIRIPFINQGLIAPGQGIFPQLTEGITTKNSTSIVVSRGLGNSRVPLRIFNRPEVVIVTLRSED